MQKIYQSFTTRVTNIALEDAIGKLITGSVQQSCILVLSVIIGCVGPNMSRSQKRQNSDSQ